LGLEFVAKRLSRTLTFIIACARPPCIHVAKIALRLRRDLGVAVDLGGRGYEDASLMAFSIQEGFVGAIERSEQGADAVLLVKDRRSGTGQVIDLVARNIEGGSDVGFDRFDGKPLEVTAEARTEVIEDDDLMTIGQQPFDKMGADKTRTTCDENFHLSQVLLK
jgi:hypothetical protein